VEEPPIAYPWIVFPLPPAEDFSGLRLRFVCPWIEGGSASVLALRQFTPLGSLEWDISSDGEIECVEVDAPWRRKGVATLMLAYAQDVSREMHWPPPRHSDHRTRQGDAWARSLGAEPAATIESWEDFLRRRDLPPQNGWS
jgi:GNAT superfamily N-acetyltransferase